MSRFRILLTVAGAMLIAAALYWNYSQPRNREIEDRFAAVFARPKVFSIKGKDFLIRFDGQDALAANLIIESGRQIEVQAKFPALHSDAVKKTQSLEIVPRLSNQDVDGFQWFDSRTEQYLSWGGNLRADPQQEYPPKSRVKFDLRPGEYKVRFYLKVNFMNPENGLCENYLLAESTMTVTGPPNVGIAPLDDPKHAFHID